jgi:hypothetical protein
VRAGSGTVAGSSWEAWTSSRRNRIEAHAGKEFRTKTGLPFSYRVIGANVIPDRTGYPLHANNFRTAFDLLPLSGPGQINAVVRGPAYVYAILTDRRIVP